MIAKTPHYPTPAGGLDGALFTPVQQVVLGLLFGQPGRRFQSGERIRLANSGTGAQATRARRSCTNPWATTTEPAHPWREWISAMTTRLANRLTLHFWIYAP